MSSLVRFSWVVALGLVGCSATSPTPYVDDTPLPTPDAGTVPPTKDASVDVTNDLGEPTPTPPTGWRSGASGDSVADGTFATWRGSPVTIAGTWNDVSTQTQIEQWSVSSGGTYGSWKGDVDDAMGAFWGGSWAQAAAGAYDSAWTSAVQAMAAGWKGKSGTFYVRLAHEMNGDWYDWSVTSKNVADFKKGWIRFVGIARAKFPAIKIVFGANNGTNSDIGVQDMWPGDAYVDVVGVDHYDMWPNIPDQKTWDAEFMATEKGGPRGLGAWLAFAKAHGKPMSIPEWGVNWANDGTPGPQDNPFYIEKMNEFFRKNAGAGPGQLLYEIYYDIDDVKAQLYPIKSNPNAAAKYKSLSWGK